MVIAWIGYCLLVAALLGLAALASERALGHFRKPVRWGWFAAIVGSVTIPLVALVAPGLFPGGTASPAVPVVGLGALATSAAGPAAAAPAGEPAFSGLSAATVSMLLGGGWALLVLGMCVYLACAYRRLRSEMRTWTPSELQGSRVLLSNDRGPAVVGIGSSVVVMPRWIAELDDRLLRLVFLHEREHQRAGDHRLFAAGIAALVLMPWNLFLWWQVSRLRLAIEFDCDRRVLARGESRRDYADALLAVGSRVSAPLLAAAAFAERKPAVERRLRRMTEPLARLRTTRTIGATGVAALAIILVLGAPRPETAMDAPQAVADQTAAAEVRQDASAAERPTFVPFDTDPILRNSREVTAALQAAYPRNLRDAGIGGSVEMWLYVDESGAVANREVKTSSGNDALDRAAGEVADVMRFESAKHQGRDVAIWVSQTFTFQSDAAGEPGAGPGNRPLLLGDILAGRRVGDIDNDGANDAFIVPADDVLNPLIVIDGVIQSPGTGMDDLRALDIDHVEVIKGPQAIERWGERARNGVVAITTKKDE